ncbi:1576_t:CDS:2 [Paraglomus brasilianum]|uniref:1576_t:CDS:1 n=1 Tax=Paraglomus brasilianum TaxID=144538 RepID=A0A9N8ZMT3_9GLOM|nr:1576_t:CDS:2 [Paraglomus brasilianum]
MDHLNCPTVFAELLPNIRSMNLSIGLPSQTTTFQLGVYPRKLTFTSPMFFSSLELSQTIETDVEPALTSATSSLEVKLKLRNYIRRKPFRHVSGSEVVPPLTACDLVNLRNVLCGSCGLVIVRDGALEKIMDLPSEHWAELLECWMCHQEDYKQAQVGELNAKETIGLVGGTYILMHPKDIEDALVVEGFTNVNVEADLLAVKLNKHLITVVLEEAGRLDTIKCNFTAFLAADFLDAAKSHATYKFIIEGTISKGPYILVWLFGWDTKMMTNALEGMKSLRMFSRDITDDIGSVIPQHMKITPVMKMLYIDCTNQNDSTRSLMTAWDHDKTVEHLVYHDDICLQLLLLLHTSNYCLAESNRVMNGFRVGFMEHNKDQE